MWGFLKGIGKVAGGLLGLGGGGGIDYNRLATILGGAGAGLGANSQANATNRGEQFGGQMDLAALLSARDLARLGLERDADNDFTANQIARERSGMDTRQDAWRKLLSAQRTLSPSAQPNVSPYAAPQRTPTDTERQGAEALSSEVMARLQGGNTVAPVTRRDTSFQYDPLSTIDPRLLQAGTGERVTGWLGTILGALGGANRNDERVRT